MRLLLVLIMRATSTVYFGALDPNKGLIKSGGRHRINVPLKRIKDAWEKLYNAENMNPYLSPKKHQSGGEGLQRG